METVREAAVERAVSVQDGVNRSLYEHCSLCRVVCGLVYAKRALRQEYVKCVHATKNCIIL